MLARGRGTIVDISSMAAIAPTPGMYFYSASKAALAAASEGLRGELRGTGVHVMTVYPGPVRTDDGGGGPRRLRGDVGDARLHARPATRPSSRARSRTASRRAAPRIVYPGIYGLTRQFPNLTRFFIDRFTPPLKALPGKGGDMSPELPLVVLDRVVATALEEDLASGDLHDRGVHRAGEPRRRARGRPRADGRVRRRRLRPRLPARRRVARGRVPRGGRARASRAGRVSGPCAGGPAILMGERVALNLVQRMCGVATQARAYVDAVPAGLHDAHHRHAQDHARPARPRALRRPRRRRAQPPRRPRRRGPHQGRPRRGVRRRPRRRSSAPARPRPTRRRSSARSIRSSSSTRPSRPAPTSSCSTTCRPRPWPRR